MEWRARLNSSSHCLARSPAAAIFRRVPEPTMINLQLADLVCGPGLQTVISLNFCCRWAARWWAAEGRCGEGCPLAFRALPTPPPPPPPAHPCRSLAWFLEACPAAREAEFLLFVDQFIKWDQGGWQLCACMCVSAGCGGMRLCTRGAPLPAGTRRPSCRCCATTGRRCRREWSFFGPFSRTWQTWVSAHVPMSAHQGSPGYPGTPTCRHPAPQRRKPPHQGAAAQVPGGDARCGADGELSVHAACHARSFVVWDARGMMPP